MLQPARLSSGITSWVKLGAAHALPAAASQMAMAVKRGGGRGFMRGGFSGGRNACGAGRLSGDVAWVCHRPPVCTGHGRCIGEVRRGTGPGSVHDSPAAESCYEALACRFHLADAGAAGAEADFAFFGTS